MIGEEYRWTLLQGVDEGCGTMSGTRNAFESGHLYPLVRPDNSGGLIIGTLSR